MSKAGGKKEREMANAAHELFLLGQKTVEARAVLAALQKQLSDASSRLADTQQVEQVIEANQQLVLDTLGAIRRCNPPSSGGAAFVPAIARG